MKTTFQVLVAQYKAALKMLRATLLATPEEVWNDANYEIRTWRLAYHTLYYAKLYLSPSFNTFAIWNEAIEYAECLGGTWEDPHARVDVEGVHTVEELIHFLDLLLVDLPEVIDVVPLEADSGFEWYPCSRLELHLNNIRHIQHHTGQIIERIRTHGINGIAWVGCNI